MSRDIDLIKVAGWCDPPQVKGVLKGMASDGGMLFFEHFQGHIQQGHTGSL